MIKISDEKYQYKRDELNPKQICRAIPKWVKLSSGIMYKSTKVGIIDKSLSKRPLICEARMCFYRFPKQKRSKFKALISTDLKLTEVEILERYTQRWSIEVVIKDLKQYLGYNQSMSSKYAPQIADLTIRCVCYIMLCSLKERDPTKPIYQILFEFTKSFENHCIEVFVKYMLKETIKAFLLYAQGIGVNDVGELIRDLDTIQEKFFNSEFYADKIVEVDDIVKMKGKIKRLKLKN